jgi:ferredoxin-nitrite reductase
VPELAKLLREGNTKWEDLNLDDVDIRMKFAGLFHRGKRTPQRFMMRLKVRRVFWAGVCWVHLE